MRVLFALLACLSAGAVAAQPAKVVVLATLHHFHADHSGYDYGSSMGGKISIGEGQMPFSKVKQISFILAAQIWLLGSAGAAQLDAVPDAASDQEFFRTQFCVAGGLPMEVVYSFEDNPGQLGEDTLDLSGIDQLKEKVDIRLGFLMKESAAAAWRQSAAVGAPEGNRINKHLVESFVHEIVTRAPSYMGLEFCGAPNAVGNAVYAAVFGYFSSSVQLGNGGAPGWLDEDSRPYGGVIVMLAVALRLAGIDFDLAELTSYSGI